MTTTVSIHAAVKEETSRLKRLTQSGEPKSRERVEAILERVRRIAQHADERCDFYAEAGITETAEAWGELATEAVYRAEAIDADTWAWV